MHVQIKTDIPPPEGVGGKVNGWTIHDDFRAKEHNSGWLYEPIGRSSEGKIVFPVPEWLPIESINICVHDDEILKNGVGTILCSDSGKPLSPYFIPKIQRREMPNALFSLPFSYVRITLDGRINFLHIEKVTPILETVETSAYATVNRSICFSDTVKVTKGYCKTCGTEFDVENVWDHMGHHVTPSLFDVKKDCSIYDKAIRAVYKKVRALSQHRPFFVYT